MLRAVFAVGLLLASAAGYGQVPVEGFVDAPRGAKMHSASGFLCPLRMGSFERDAAGKADPSRNADFCAYSAPGGLYGTVTLIPLESPYDPASSLAGAFAEQEAAAARRVADGMVSFRPAAWAAPFALYERVYDIDASGELHDRILLSGAAFGQWAVEAAVEYADPRDRTAEDDFLHAVYAEAERDIRGK